MNQIRLVFKQRIKSQRRGIDGELRMCQSATSSSIQSRTCCCCCCCCCQIANNSLTIWHWHATSKMPIEMLQTLLSGQNLPDCGESSRTEACWRTEDVSEDLVHLCVNCWLPFLFFSFSFCRLLITLTPLSHRTSQIRCLTQLHSESSHFSNVYFQSIFSFFRHASVSSTYPWQSLSR